MGAMRRKRTAGVARHAGFSLAKFIPKPRARVRPVRLKLSSRQADDPLLRLQFAIVIAPGNLRLCRGQTYVPVFGVLLPDRTWMVCIWRKTSHRERGGDDESWRGLSADRTWRRYRGGQGVCPGGRRPGLRPYRDL